MFTSLTARFHVYGQFKTHRFTRRLLAICLLAVAGLLASACYPDSERSAPPTGGETTEATQSGAVLDDSTSEQSTEQEPPPASSNTEGASTEDEKTSQAPEDQTSGGEANDKSGGVEEGGTDDRSGEDGGAEVDAGNSNGARDGKQVEPSEEEASLLEIDPNVYIGKLDNGLTYYVRYNDSPGGRVELRLAVRAGSLHETEEQSGYAHFLEHMMFNGTEIYPRNDLIAELEALGSDFGPDLNAFTAHTFTYYHLSLPDNETGTIIRGVEILKEWAAHATLTEDDVVAERGVIAEEYRESRQGLSGRFSEASSELLLAGSNLYDKDPLGTLESINSVTSEGLREFYEDWYRPELMAVVAVGDFDTTSVKQIISERFGNLPAADPNAPAWTASRMISPPEPQVIYQIDPEYPRAAVVALQLAPQPALHTQEGQKTEIARELGFDMIIERLRTDLLSGEAPFDEVEEFNSSQSPAVSYLGALVYTDPSLVENAIEHLVEEFERVRRHGFGVGEYQRATEAMRQEIEQEYAARSTKQDTEYANEYVYHFVYETFPWSTTEARNTSLKLIEELSPEEVASELVALLDVEQPRLWIVVNAAEEASLPSDEEVLEIRETAREEALSARSDVVSTESALMERPEAAEITNSETLAHDVTLLEFANGARVLLKPTVISANYVHLWAVSPGGFSSIADEDVKELDITAEIARNSGVGPHDPVTLHYILADKVAGIRLALDHNSDYLVGGGAAEDLETLFALLHLSMTEPRAEEAVTEGELRQQRQIAEGKDTLPSLALDAAVVDARYGDDPRYRTLPTLAELESFDLESGLASLRDRFADAGDFDFILVGDFYPDEAKELAQSYIGTLPDSGKRESYVDPQRDPPAGIVLRKVRAGQDDQGEVVLMMTGEVTTDLRVRIAASLLEHVVDSRVNRNLREKLSATYAPSVSITSQDPDNLIETYISIGADPDRLDEVSAALRAELADLATNGPTEDEFEAAQSVLFSEYELVSNEYWGRSLIFWAFHPDESWEDIGSRAVAAKVLSELTREEVTDLAATAFPADRFIEVRLLPTS